MNKLVMKKQNPGTFHLLSNLIGRIITMKILIIIMNKMMVIRKMRIINPQIIKYHNNKKVR